MRAILSIFVAGVVLMVAHSAMACSCRPPASAEEAVRDTPIILWGRAVSVKRVGDQNHYTVEAATAKGGIATVISTHKDGATCGVTLEIGKMTLIGAYNGDGGLQTDICTQLTLMHYRQEILQILDLCEPLGPCPKL